MAISSAIGGIGYLYVICGADSSFGTDTMTHRLILVVVDNNHVRYFATFCIVAGTYTTIGIIIAWCKYKFNLVNINTHPDQSDAHNLGSETKKATGIPMFMAIGQCGSVLGSHLYPTAEGPRYM